MFFRFWYHTCQIGMFGFFCICVGVLMPSSSMRSIGLGIVIPLGLVGATLGGIMAVRGIKSKCPICGEQGSWELRYRNCLTMVCPACGIVGGNPLPQAVPMRIDNGA